MFVCCLVTELMAERFPAGPGLAPGGDPSKVPVFLLMVSGQIESAEVSAHLCYDNISHAAYLMFARHAR